MSWPTSRIGSSIRNARAADDGGRQPSSACRSRPPGATVPGAAVVGGDDEEARLDERRDHTSPLPPSLRKAVQEDDDARSDSDRDEVETQSLTAPLERVDTCCAVLLNRSHDRVALLPDPRTTSDFLSTAGGDYCRMSSACQGSLRVNIRGPHLRAAEKRKSRVVRRALFRGAFRQAGAALVQADDSGPRVRLRVQAGLQALQIAATRRSREPRTLQVVRVQCSLLRPTALDF